MNGLLRYNEIQKALSPLRKEKGWKLPVGGFQQIASKIYQRTKSLPIQKVTSRIESIWSSLFFPEELLENNPFFTFDADARNGMGLWNPELMAEDVYVNSPQLHGPEFLIASALLNYEQHFSDFTDYCNAGRGIWWNSSGDAPTFHFTQPEFDTAEQKWVTTLALGQDDGYGYTPGIGATVIEGVKIEKPAPPVKPPEKEPEKEIEKIKAETERLEASRRRIEELNKAVEKLDSQLERDLITKNEYKKYLKKLYGM